MLLPFLSIVLPAGSYCTEGNPHDPDRIFTPQEMFVSAANSGLGGAGCALPWSLQSVFENPALLYSCRNGAARISRSVVFGYGRDSLFDRYIVPVGMSYSGRRNAAALNIRALSSSSGLDEYEATATLCRRVWRSADPVGPVDFGVNVRVEYADWEQRGLDTLASIFSFVAPSGAKTKPDSTVRNGIPPERGRFVETRLLFDLGFFKPEIAENIDFGITIKNLAGFFRGRETPDTVRQKEMIGSLHDSIAVVRTSESYGGGYREYGGLVPGKYAVLAGGLNYRFTNPGRKWSLSFPVDAAIYGLFDRKMDEVVAFHVGVQAHFTKDFFLRVGYSHAPAILPTGFKSVSLVHNLSFGASILPPGLPMMIDCYFSNFDWGMNVGVDY
jgi:hypothetical protein